MYFSSLSLRAEIRLLINSSLPYPLGFYTTNVHRLAVSNAFPSLMADKSGRAQDQPSCQEATSCRCVTHCLSVQDYSNTGWSLFHTSTLLSPALIQSTKGRQKLLKIINNEVRPQNIPAFLDPAKKT